MIDLKVGLITPCPVLSSDVDLIRFVCLFLGINGWYEVYLFGLFEHIVYLCSIHFPGK